MGSTGLDVAGRGTALGKVALGMALALPLLCLLVPAPAHARTLYRCEAGDGARSYTSERIPGQVCSVVQQAASPPRTAAAGTPAATAPAAGSSTAVGSSALVSRPVEFRSAAGGEAPSLPAAGNARVTRGAVYSYVRDGVTHYTNVRPGGAEPARVLFSYIEACYACVARPGADFSRVGLNLNAFAEEVRAASRQHGVEEALVRAVIHAESAFNPNALSHKGAQGLMQLIPATAERFGVTDAFEPAQNISGGVRYLAWLLNRFEGNVTLASAAYNAGEGAVDRFSGIPPYAETQRYVERVATLAERYRSELAAN